MLSYARYCQDQATACARRARLASSPEIVAYCRNLEFRWLRLAEQAHGTGGALGHESGLTATSFPLHDKPAAYGQVRLVLDKRVGDAVTFALTIGAVRSA
jgi:hypothetical protein